MGTSVYRSLVLHQARQAKKSRSLPATISARFAVSYRLLHSSTPSSTPFGHHPHKLRKACSAGWSLVQRLRQLIKTYHSRPRHRAAPCVPHRSQPVPYQCCTVVVKHSTASHRTAPPSGVIFPFASNPVTNRRSSSSNSGQ